MVEGVRDVVKAIAKCKPGEAREPTEKELLAKFTALCEDTLIELQYSLLLIPNEVSCSCSCCVLCRVAALRFV